MQHWPYGGMNRILERKCLTLSPLVDFPFIPPTGCLLLAGLISSRKSTEKEGGTTEIYKEGVVVGGKISNSCPPISSPYRFSSLH